MDDQRIDAVLNKYPFYMDWKKGKLDKKIFRQNMQVFRAEIISDGGLTPEEIDYVIKREAPKKWGLF